MVEIRPYISKFKDRSDKEILPEYRFVAYADGIPALMIEFFAADFHIYGPRGMQLDELLGNLRYATDEVLRYVLPALPLEFPLFSGATMTCAGNDGEPSVWHLDGITWETDPPGNPFRNLESSFERVRRKIPAETSFLNITLPSLGFMHWGDIEGTPNARSGFGFGSRMDYPWAFHPGRPLSQRSVLTNVIKSLSSMPLEREDLLAIAEFAIRNQRDRYV